MFRVWKILFLTSMSVLLLAGCNQSLEENAATGIKAAKEAFDLDIKERTEEIADVKIYKPAGFAMSDKSDAQNIVFTNKEDTYILFINPNEKKGSQLFYDLLQANPNKKIIDEATFTDDGVFGFAAVVQNGKDQVELIASVDGAKMTTLVKNKKIEEKLTKMMEIVRSVKQDF
ncbi:hypothetical protein FITA111629_06615 [Filibacter tadaridae]|uniref:DUF4367 domain-containing protein n=1 Tax=Filibacter tadaridae TaxID=2483811 RepID=A0A3P5X6E9_9BACL|nr:hypothetical protein [Filibacter tadaridae]VDC26849.1 hypothetical protein FILTAD_01533 [Filibacter tadaridae]